MVTPPEVVIDFEPLVRAVTARTIAARTLPAVIDYDDILQEARLAVLQLSARHDPDRAPMAAWLISTLPWELSRVIRTASHDRRSKHVQVHSVDADTLRDVTADPARVDDEAQARVDCREILSALTVEHRRVLWWKFAEGHSARQISVRLGVSLEDAESLIKRALRAARSAASGVRPLNQPLNDIADRQLLIDALRSGSTSQGKLPGRSWTCKQTGLSEYRYERLMRWLVADGLIVGRGNRQSGYLAMESAA